MNKQLSIHGGHVWRMDSATRRRGRKGVAEAREVIRNARANEIGVQAQSTAVRSLFGADSEHSSNGHAVVEAA